MARSKERVVFAAGIMGVTVLLQGCGGGGGPSPSPGPSPITTTTTTTDVRTPGLSAKAAADWMNKQYLEFDEADDSSPLGLTISMASQPESFWGNVYCSKFTNPKLGKTGCSLGRTDCRFSASLYNHKMLVDNVTGATLLGLGRATGIVFNQTLTETYWGKCSYIWDGASDRKYNVGCGDGALSPNCSSSNSAYGNICPSTGKICTANDTEVKRGFCSDWGGDHPIPPTHGGNVQCAIPGPAIDYHLQDGWKPSKDFLRVMAKNRVKYNGGSDAEGSNIEKWNEIVIDEHLLIPKINSDPAVAIPAIVYVKSSNPENKKNAMAMRDEFCKFANLAAKIPIIAVDTSIIGAPGPFVVESELFDEIV